ncbi:MAG: peptidase M28 family protein [Candidatus Neomarinimicrobiota bacterium]|nr:MAG: peptidase M28 family protein [Candidatus Neomarinimicrobiota bacterium]
MGLGILAGLGLILSCSQPATPIRAYQPAAQQIIQHALQDSAAFARLAYLVDTFGPRLSGSESLEKAIDWCLKELQATGLENVHAEPVMVPHWVRGEEALTLLQPREARLALLGLGGSVGTPPGGITAQAVVVRSFDDLKQKADQVAGKIVVYNAPFTTYGKTVMYRYRGAIEAARYGAVASLIRSVGPVSLNTPHTGGMAYADSIPRIPQAAITIEAAEMLQRMYDRGQTPVLKLVMGARTLPDAPSRNVIAELTGSEKPEEVVILSGHIDSWDVGQGAMDDASGCVASWEAVRLLKELGLRPRRTLRVVFWTNEENGTRGGRTYAREHADELDRHVLAIETDEGVFTPSGFGFSGSDDAFTILSAIGMLLQPLQAGTITRGGGGADISHLHRQGVPVAGLNVDGSHYFWYHHTEADMMDKLNRDDFNRCVAALAVMAYVVADTPEPLPR